MIWAVAFLLVTVLILLFISVAQRDRVSSLTEKLEKTELQLDAEQISHEETLRRLKSYEDAHNPERTAADMVKSAKNRMKLRKNWQDWEQYLEDQHNTGEKKHLEIVRQISDVPSLILNQGGNP